MPRLYDELADWWPLMSAPEEYASEATVYAQLLAQMADIDVHEVLELGSGGGNNASHLKSRFRMTLVDASEGMLAVSRRLNPGCEHVLGDMRSVRLGRIFDAVFVHDAVMYMTTPDDLRAVIETAFAHTRPGGVAVFVPDETTETFYAATKHGGHDGQDGRALRYLEWTHPPDGTISRVSFVFLLREADGSVRTVYDEHEFGLFPRGTWLALLEDAGFAAGALVHTYGAQDERYRSELFVGKVPPRSA